MTELGIPSGLTVIEGAPHPFLGKQVWFDQMLDVADDFFTRHLKSKDFAEVVPPHNDAR